MVTFILGRRKSGKSIYLIKEIKKKISEKKSIFLLVPEQNTLSIENKIIKKLKTKGIIDLEIITFEKLSNNLLKNSIARRKKILKEQGQKMILSNVLKKLKLSYFKNLLNKEFFLTKLLKTINDLRENNIENLNFSFLKQKKVLSIKLKELLMIKKEYCSILVNSDYIDLIQSIPLQQNILEKNKLFVNSYFFIDGFFSFSINQINILKSLFKSCKEVYITLPYDKMNLFDPINLILKKLIDFSKLLKKKIIIHKCKSSYFKKPILLFLENFFIKNKKEKFNTLTDGLFFKEFANPNIEIKKVFESIALLLKKGVLFSSIKIVCNDLKTYGTIIKIYKEIYKFPIFINEKIYIYNHPIIQCIILLLELSYKFNTKKILDLLKTGFFDIKQNEIENLEIFVKENEIEDYQWEKSFYDKNIEIIRLKIIKIFLFRKKINKLKTYKEKIIFLYKYLEDLNLYEQLNERIEYYKKIKLYKSLYIDTQIWNLLIDTFDQCVMFLGEVKGNTKDLMLILKSSLKTEYLKILPTNLEEIEILSSENMFMESLDYVFIIGASEGNFPITPEKENLFSISELKLLETQFNWYKSFDYKRKKKLLETYFALTSSNEGIYISYSLKNKKGEDQTLSFILKNIFCQIKFMKNKKYSQEKNELVLVSEKKSLLDLIDSLSKNSLNSFEKSLLKYFLNKKEKIILNDYFFSKSIDKNKNYLTSDFSKFLFFNSKSSVFSISKLENYASCPYSFFIRYALRPLKHNDYLLSNLKIGSIYHNALEIFQKKYLTQNLNKSIIIKKSNELFDKIFKSNKFDLKYLKESSLYRLLKIKKMGIENFIFLSKQQNQDLFKGKYFELQFSKNSFLGPLNIKLNNNININIEGKIDRVDILKHKQIYYLKIIDFKLNEYKLNYSKFYDGISLQLFFYLSVLLKKSYLLLNDKFIPAALLYFAINQNKNSLNLIENLKKEKNNLQLTGEIIDNKEIINKMDKKSLPIYFNKNKNISKNSNVLSEKEFINCISHVDKKIKDILNNILNGNFNPYPYYYKSQGYKYCSYCDFKKLCNNKINFNYLTQKTRNDVLEILQKDFNKCGQKSS